MGQASNGLGRPAEFLLVEDNEADIVLTQEALRAGKISNRLHIARDGEQALLMLHKHAPYADIPTPDLILLDLNLPVKDGRAVLAEIRATPRIAMIPVAVLTSSRLEADQILTRELAASCCIVKPLDFDQLKEIVASIDHFAFSLVLGEEHDV
jgi:two-component system, chemotaxis family, response regulator Rcp1